MDIRKSKLNVGVSVAFKVITMVMAVVVKMTLVNICGNNVNGLNALYLSIIGFLSVAELGIGSAITFCMYKPIVEGDNDTVAALFNLFQKLYTIIGLIIFVGGLVVLPFLPYLAKDYDVLNVNMYLTFLIMLISVTGTYLFSAKISLINAYKNNYITTTISQGGLVFQYILQILVLYFTKSFVWYLTCRIFAVILQWFVCNVVFKKDYYEIVNRRTNLDSATQKLVKTNIKALFMHKIGYVLVNTVDSIIISAFVGVVALGEYSNYTMILTSMTGIITLVFTSLTSVIGHLCVEEDKQTAKGYFDSFHLLNFVIGAIFFLGYYAIIDSLIGLIFSPELIVEKNISFVITLNGFVQFMRHGVLTFKDATGVFYQDRWKPFCEGIINIILSIILVKLIGVTGVIVATIITNLVICHIIEPYVLLKNAFTTSPFNFYIRNYGKIMAFFLTLVILDRFLFKTSKLWLDLILNGALSVIFSIGLCIVILLFSKKHNSQIRKNLRKSLNE